MTEERERLWNLAMDWQINEMLREAGVGNVPKPMPPLELEKLYDQLAKLSGED